MTIGQLIDKLDTVEIIRDEIAAILAVEVAEQQTLATAAGRDPLGWKLRIFLERSNPWSEWIDAPDQDSVDATPIVGVSREAENFNASRSDPVQRQHSTATYNIDCYGYGVSEDDGAGGHIPGDRRAALEAQRAVRLVRNILMAGTYTYLGHRGLVGRRWIRSVQHFQPALGDRPVQGVVAARISFEVDFNEFSPQVAGEPLELVSSGVHRAETGEIYFTADYAGA